MVTLYMYPKQCGPNRTLITRPVTHPYLRPRDTAARVQHAEGGAGEPDAAHDVPLHERVGQQGVREPHLRDGIEMLIRL